MKRSTLLLVLSAAALIPTAATAVVTVNIDEVGSDVVSIASGSLDLTGLTDVGPFFLVKGIEGDLAYIGTGTGDDVEGYSGLTGPALFGSGGFFSADSFSGDPFGFNGNYGGAQYVFLPTGYSGSVISSSGTWLGQTIASLGLTPGTYTYLSQNDSLIINIGAVGGVPEPATWAMLLLGFGVVGWGLRRRRRAIATHQLA